jgi:hypothetical protein
MATSAAALTIQGLTIPGSALTCEGQPQIQVGQQGLQLLAWPVSWIEQVSVKLSEGCVLDHLSEQRAP